MGRDAFDPPLCVGALFDAAQEEEPQEKGGPQDTGRAGQDAHSPLFVQEYFVREVPVGPGGAVLVVREFSFHPRNANFLWPDANLIGRYVQEHWGGPSPQYPLPSFIILHRHHQYYHHHCMCGCVCVRMLGCIVCML